MGMTNNSIIALSLALALALVGPAAAQTPAPQSADQPANRTGLMPGRPMAPSASPELIEAREFVARQQWREAADRVEVEDEVELAHVAEIPAAADLWREKAGGCGGGG